MSCLCFHSLGSSEEELSGSLRLRAITHKAHSDFFRSEVRSRKYVAVCMKVNYWFQQKCVTRLMMIDYFPKDVFKNLKKDFCFVSLRRCHHEGLLHSCCPRLLTRESWTQGIDTQIICMYCICMYTHISQLPLSVSSDAVSRPLCTHHWCPPGIQACLMDHGKFFFYLNIQLTAI